MRAKFREFEHEFGPFLAHDVDDDRVVDVASRKKCVVCMFLRRVRRRECGAHASLRVRGTSVAACGSLREHSHLSKVGDAQGVRESCNARSDDDKVCGVRDDGIGMVGMMISGAAANDSAAAAAAVRRR